MNEPIAHYLDHAVLKPELTTSEAAAQIMLGVEHEVRTVCVRPCDIALAVDLCRDTATEVCCVLSFPHGTALPTIKRFEAQQYVALGVREIDMVVNYGLVRSGRWDDVHADIAAVTSVANPAGVLMKVIFETAALTVEQIERATAVAIAAEAAFVKTSTGFGGGGATDEAIAAMVRAGGRRIGVKASGGVRDLATAQHFLNMGCTRLGVGAASTPVICSGVSSCSSPNKQPQY